jgi:hypothetical protein
MFHEGTCKVHGSNKASYICYTCNKEALICAECILEEHKNDKEKHKYKKVSDLIKEMQDINICWPEDENSNIDL